VGCSLISSDNTDANKYKSRDAFGAVDGLSYLQPAVRRTEFLELHKASVQQASGQCRSRRLTIHRPGWKFLARNCGGIKEPSLSPHELEPHQADFRAIGSAFFRCDLSPCFLHIFPSILFCAAMMRSLRTTPRIRSRMESLTGCAHSKRSSAVPRCSCRAVVECLASILTWNRASL
jgi:hypothetical protein